MDFEKAVQIILRHEGGYVDNPADPGGETNFGISKRAYPDLDIKNLTEAEAVEIYRRDYWDAIRCDEIPDFMRLMVFDTAVNQGRGVAVRYLQAVSGADIDGIVGPQTLARANALKLRDGLLRFAENRKDRYFKTRGFDTFGRGWIARLMDVLFESLTHSL